MIKRRLLSLLVTGLSTFVSLQAYAAVYYVAPSGSDTNSCGPVTSPCRSISYTVSNRIRGGDEVIVKAGQYNEFVRISAGGTSSASTYIHAASGEKVVIDGTGLSNPDGLIDIFANYVRIEGFEIANSRSHGITAYNSHHIQIVNNTVHDTVSTGMWFGQDYGQTGCHDILVQGNTVYRTVKMNQTTLGSTGGGWGQGINLSCFGYTEAKNLNAIGNTVYNNWGEGIGVQNTNGALVSQNVVYDNFSANIYLDGAINTVVDRNLIYYTGDSRFAYASKGTGPLGVGLSIETVGSRLENIAVTNNILVGNNDGIRHFQDADPKGLLNSLIANNTLVNNRKSGIFIQANSAHSGNTFTGNIVYASNASVLATGSASGFAYDHNAWFGGSAGPFQGGSGDVTTNPLLANPNVGVIAGTVSASHYMLQALSPLAAAGRSLSSVKMDYFGNARSTSFSIGAHQVGGQSIPPAPVEPMPTPPPTTAPMPPPSLNLVLNSGFENQLTSWAEDWGNAQIVSTSPRSGNASLRVGSGAGGLAQIIRNLTPGAKYTMTVYARMSSRSANDGYVGVGLYSSGGQKIGGDILARVRGRSWTKYTVQFVVPSTASYLKIWAYKDTATSQFLYVDDFQLVQD